MIVEWVKLYEYAHMPTQAYEGDAGWDLTICEDVVIPEGEGRDVRTGIAVAIPRGYYGRIVGRSSALRKKGVLVVEGIIDAGFRGELFCFAHYPMEPLRIQDPVGTASGRVKILKTGTSIAQLIISPIPTVEWSEVVELNTSERGTSGFGSSGR